MKVAVPDIMAALLDPWKDSRPTGADLNMLQGDAQLVIVAGRSVRRYNLCRS
jgi:hypothetical protein